MGKGSGRRPRLVSRDEYERRWEETFGKPSEQKKPAKPPAQPRVDNIEAFWLDPPPSPSARLEYWLVRAGSGWRRNSRLRGLGYYESAEYFGVYLWEWLNVLYPVLLDLEQPPLTAPLTKQTQ